MLHATSEAEAQAIGVITVINQLLPWSIVTVISVPVQNKGIAH